MINILIIIVLSAVFAILFVNVKLKGIISVATVIILGLISSFFSVKALMGLDFNVLMKGTMLFGNVPVRIDALSGWFILIINFTMITGAVYGINYMKRYMQRKSDITLHCIAFILVYVAMLGICSVQNGFIFLLLWELMALSVFILVIFSIRVPLLYVQYA